ncbi:MAG: ATP-binding protein [Roseburia sp.]|nr:ATP-binding protein [Roseburia sp.]
MLVGFSVSNYKSFKEEQRISMIASKIARHKDHTTTEGARKLLKTALIFGANAGGKSNFIQAVRFSRNIILKGLDNVSVDKKYFRIEKEMYSQPGVFEYRMIINETEYCYGFAFSYHMKEILAEWLIRMGDKGEETYIFNRETDENGMNHAKTEMVYENPDENARMRVYLEDFGEEISDSLKKKTILSDIAARVNDKSSLFRDIIAVYEWFENIVVIFPTSKYGALNEIASDNELRTHFGNIMSFFDTGIEGIEGQEQEMDFDKVLQFIPKEEAEKIKINIANDIKKHPVMFKIDKKIYVLRKDENDHIFYYKMLLNHGNQEDLFEYVDESDGTRRLFDLIPILFLIGGERSVIFIDEIDRSLHTNLTKRLIQLFYQFLSKNSSQLIITTHDSNLLDLDLLRQDEIWFVERNENHSSQLYSLSRYKERFDKKIDKEYLLGRYGAIPIFDESIISLEEPDGE